MDTSLLPSEFSDLEPFASRWCLLTEAERYAARLSSSMSEIQTFYDAAMARGEDMIAYCDRYPLKGMPEQAVKSDAAHVLADHGFVCRRVLEPTTGARYRCGISRSDRGARPLI